MVGNRAFSLAVLLSIAAGSVLTAAGLPSGFTETFYSGLSDPTAMTVVPDGRLFVCEQGGKLRVIKNGSLLSAAFVTLTVDNTNERGLLGVAVDPNFLFNQYVYVYYTVPGSPPHNRVSRLTADGDVAESGSEVILFEVDDLSSATIHNGGALHFGLDGKLYVAVGDAGNSGNAQDMTNLFGKILRLHPDGSIPTDNPFYGTASGNNRAIWALGLRNPFTFAVQPITGRIFVNDVGQASWEEIDDAHAGDNFGWPACEGDCGNPSYEDPFYTYGHVSNQCSIAGGDFYDPDIAQFPAGYVGKYFFADYCAGWIKTVDPASGSPSASNFATNISFPVDVRVDHNGYLYYLERGNGRVSRITYTGSSSPTITADPQSQLISSGHPVTFDVSATGEPPLFYQWQRNGTNITGATSSSYTIASVGAGDNSAQFRCVVSNSFPPAATSAAAVLTVTSNQPPTATITSPAPGTTYAAGQTVPYSGTASDPEAGVLTYTWWVNFHHDTHFHPFLPPTTGSTGGSITIPTVGEVSANVWYRIHLRVTDPVGLTDETFVDVIPRTTTMTLNTNPNGLQLSLDGQPFTAPQSVVGVEGIVRTISAPSPQSSGGNTYHYVSWSDGGLQTHEISTPVSDTTYTALFTSGPTPTPSVTGTPTITRTPTRTPTRTATSTPTRTPTRTPTPLPLPAPWLQQDIGSVGIPGSASLGGGAFTLLASGADIEGSADEFRYVYQPLTGDGSIVARVGSIQNTDAWAKGGVMIRETLSAASKHAMMVLTPLNGLAFQRRASTGGGTTHTPGAGVVAPYWVRLVRSGSTFTASSSPDGVNWTVVGSDTISMTAGVFVGLALTSHNDAVLCTAVLDGVAVTSGGPTPTSTWTQTPSSTPTRTNTPTITASATSTRTASASPTRTGSPTISPTATVTGSATPTRTPTRTATFTSTNTPTRTPTPLPLPAPWLQQDIGSVGIPGSASFGGGAFTIVASGADIEGNADEFGYLYQPLTGDGSIVARVGSIQNTDAWAKGGVMIRETLSAASKHAMMVLTPLNGLAFQRRASTGGGTTHTPGAGVVAPYWVRLARSGSTFTASSSPDGVTWTVVGSDTISMTAGVFVGLALTSHNNAVLCTAVLDGVAVTSGGPTPTSTWTQTPSSTPTGTNTPTITASRTATRTPTQTNSPGSPTASATRTGSPTFTRTATGTPTPNTPTISPSATRTFTPTWTATLAPTTTTPSFTPTRTATATWTPSSTPTATHTPVPGAPTVDAIAPSSGPPAGGTGTTITGTNFVSPASVTVGGVAATGIVVVDGAHITATVPGLAAGTLHDVTVTTNGAPLQAPSASGTLADGWFADFSDVPQANLFHDDIELIFRSGVTGGCGSGIYCPLDLVTRAQMAVLILKSKLGAGYQPPPATGTLFADVPAQAFAAAWIEDFYNRGITVGCATNPLRYCPDAPVTRQQMAVFLLRGEHGEDYVPPACAQVFGDVPCPSQYADWIGQLAVEGITAGCGGGNFCPLAATARQQMATFLVRTFGLSPFTSRRPAVHPVLGRRPRP